MKRIRKINQNKSEAGFAIALSVLLLVVMSLMGASLIMITSNDHKQNSKRDVYQQTFYAAETGISYAKQMLIDHVASKGLPKNPKLNAVSQSNNYCPVSLFPSLKNSAVYYLPIQGMNRGYADEYSLNDRIEARNNGQATPESIRLEKYRYYFYITYAPDLNGNTSVLKSKTVSSSSGSGSSAAVGTSYKNQGSSTAYYYSIFSCARGEDNSVVALESVVSIIQ